MTSRNVFLAAVLSAAMAVGAASAAAFAEPWPHTDVPGDPAIVFGQLPNGMRYLIRHNESPKGGISLRLRIATGSEDESDADEGIAHFMEHMAFRGTAHFADGEAFKTLEGLGASRGADSNAFTTDDHTVFMFDVAKSDPAALDTGFLLLRDIASEALIDPEAVDTERNAVLAEARQGDVPAFHSYKGDLAAALSPREADALLPIGKISVVQNATAEQLRAFYEAHYRPENATLIVVGDVDPKAVEAKIVASFGDWHTKADAQSRPVHAFTPAGTPRFTAFSEAGAPASVEMSYVLPYDGAPDTVAHEFHDIARDTALTILNLRLQKLSHKENPPLISASGSWQIIPGVTDIARLSASYAPGKAEDALKALHETYESALRDGFRPEELKQSLDSARVYFENEATGADTTLSKNLAQDYLAIIDENGVISSPAENLELFDNVAKRLTPEDLRKELAAMFAGAPSVFVSSPTPIDGGQTTLASAFAASVTPPLALAAADVSQWPYAKFGTSGRVVAKKYIAAFDVTQIVFANGVRATIKPTKFRDGQVLVGVGFGKGRLGLPKDKLSSSWALGAFTAGGLGKIDTDDLKTVMAGKAVGTSFGVDDESFDLSGQTRSSDLASELQIMGAYLIDPGWRPEAFDRLKASMTAILSQASGSPGGVFGMEAGALAHNDDPRWQFPSADDVRNTKLDETKSLLAAGLAQGPVDVTIVGDISVAAAIGALKTTLGALPKHYVAPTVIAGDEQLPQSKPVPLALRHQGGKDQAIAFVAWPTEGFWTNPHESRVLKVLQLVMSQRLFDLLRTKEGITYTPSVGGANSLATSTYGYLCVTSEVPPAKIPVFYAAVDRAIAELKNNPIDADELARARDPHVQDVVHEQQTNEYWLSVLKDSQIDPRWFDVIKSTVPDLKTVTAADVEQAAQKYLAPGKAWKMVVLPEGFMMASDQP